MVVQPCSSGNWTDLYDPTAPLLKFTVEVFTSGPLHIWARGHNNNGQDTLFVSMDNGALTHRYLLQIPAGAGYEWNTKRRQFTVSPGIHEFVIQAREPDTVVDKIVLTCDGTWRPNGAGPPQSDTSGDVNRPPSAGDDSFTVGEDTSANSLGVLSNDNDPDGDSLSITAVDSVTNGATVNIVGDLLEYSPSPGFSGVDSFDYTISDGELSDTATVMLMVQATPTGAGGVFQQGDDSACLLVVEAESFETQVAATSRGPAAWEPTSSPSGHSGSGAMVVQPCSSGNWTDLYDPTAPLLKFTVEVFTSGPLHIWARGHNNNGQDTLFVSMDNGALTHRYLLQIPAGAGYEWNTKRRQFTVSPGIHEFVIQAREPDTVVDKIVLTCDGTWRPNGAGPPQSDRTPSTPSLRISDASILEGDTDDTTATFAVTLAPVSAGPVSVNYASSDVNAEAGSDYQATSGVLNFAAGESTRTFPVTVFADTEEEGNETFEIVLSGATGADLGAAVGTCTILGDDQSPPGLLVRPSNPGCVLPNPPLSTTGVELVSAYPGILASTPVAMVHEPGDDSTWYYAERNGTIRAFENSPTVNSKRTFLNLENKVVRENESGLEGFAFHPDWATNREVFVTYTARDNPSDEGLTLYLSRFRSLDGGQTLAKSTEEVLVSLYNSKRIHFGSRLRFGPFDGYLYWGMGDFNRRTIHAHNPNTLPGSFLRIDVDGTSAFGPYGIPPDNPFVNGGGRPEVWAYGFRNPWGFGFDSITGELWCGDVGDVLREEINLVEKGKNYGWHFYQGDLCSEGATAAQCADPSLVPPIAAFARDTAHCVIGGTVYRGSAIPGLYGAYIYGDWWFNTLYALRFDSNGNPTPELLGTTAGSIRSIDEDENHEIYVTAGRNFYKLMPGTGGSPSESDFPQLLSEVPCVNPANPVRPLVGLIPYDINVPFWSDGAIKERWFTIPDNETIDILPDGDLLFPIGTVFLKNFFLNTRIVETRLFVRHQSGGWAGYSYEWNGAQTDATLLEVGKTVTVEGQSWTFPSRGECVTCHTAAANFALGPELLQLNRSITYPSTGITANQLQTLEHIGMFSTGLPAPAASLPALPETDDLAESLTDRARAYLHSNCSNCHRPGSGAPVDLDFRFDTALAAMNICDVAPSKGDLGIAGAMLLAPGDPSSSILAERLRSLGAERMAPIGKNLADLAGTTLIDDWISSILSCP